MSGPLGVRSLKEYRDPSECDPEGGKRDAGKTGVVSVSSVDDPSGCRDCCSFVGLTAFLGLFILSTGLVYAEDTSLNVPPQAAAVGYKVRTFATAFTAQEVDVANTARQGFKWYPYRFFGSVPKLDSLVLNQDGSITLLGDVTGPNGEIASAVDVSGPDKFRGTVFGGGGYFEATFRFDPRDVVRTEFRGWPAWWAMAIEHMAKLDTRQWPGQPKGFERFIEVDFFEYDLSDYVKSGRPNHYGGVLRDWFGPEGKLEPMPAWSRLFIREVPAATDFTQYHRYGFLWVPATSTGDGYAEFYFDDRKIGARLAWKKYVDEEPPPKPPRMFSILDRNHLVLILGTGPGQPMTVKSVNVWQASGAENWKR
ncbi:hypothetical protein ACSHT2_27150 [Bradyrhizobium sp. PUT101]|uniref:hypothetical protein n=1 Tax=Bradyrhizobium sp. PUT101 TaxID=3447427 RepID=UPI003F87205E